MNRRRVHRALLVGILLITLMGGAAPAFAQVPKDQMTTTTAAGQSLVFHHLKRYEQGIALLEKEGPPTYRRVKKALGIDKMPPIDVWVVPRVSDYYQLHNRVDDAPKWAVGLSFSGRHEIIVSHAKQSPREVLRTFSHELAHVAVDQARGKTPVPRWFNEGFAVMMAQEWNAKRSEKLSRAASTGGLIRFEYLWNTFPSHHLSANLAYDQSFHFVRWLQQKYGKNLYARVMKRVRGGRSFRRALATETGTSFPLLEAHWRRSLTRGTSFWSILSDDIVVFFGVGVFFVIALVVARRRRRRQLASMEDEEVDDAWSYDASRYPLPGQQPPDDEPPS